MIFAYAGGVWSIFGRKNRDADPSAEVGNSSQFSAQNAAGELNYELADQETVAYPNSQRQDFALDDLATVALETVDVTPVLGDTQDAAADRTAVLDTAVQNLDAGAMPATKTTEQATVQLAQKTKADTAAGTTSTQPSAASTNAHDNHTQSAYLAPDFSKLHAQWRDQLSKIGGSNPLLHFDDSAHNRIDLSTTHPGGLAQFITGQKILLSSLIRDDVSLRKAKQAAGRVTDKATEMRNMRGLETVHLGIGIASWQFEGDNFCGPVLLRPLAIRRYGRDFELKLKGGVLVNPELVQMLRSQFGIIVNANTLVALSQAEGVFKPQPVIERLKQMAAGIPGFAVQPRLVVSSFSSVASRMTLDMVGLDTPLLRALAGDADDIRALKAAYRPVNPPPFDNRAPETDTHIYDADAQQDDIICQIAAGHSLVVHTLPGAGGTQTVVNAIGALVREGKKVLVVSPRTATIDGIAHRLTRAGLQGLVTTPRRMRRNLVDAIGRNETAQPVNTRDVDQALVRLRKVLVDYRQALDAKHPKLGVSPMDALRELTKLSTLPLAPSTDVRLSETALNALALDRTSVAEALTEVARLGQFQYGPEDSPWYGVTFTTTEEARGCYASAVELAETKLPRLVSLAQDLLEQTALKPYDSLYELGIYLRLLTGIRETLDKFTSEVYDRSLTEVIAAHAPRSSGDTMSAANRRRLKKLAREYVRPGVTVTDMYARLVEIQQQRVLWQRYCTVPGTRPELPLGLADTVAAFQTVFEETSALDKVLQVDNDMQKMRNLNIPQLSKRLAALAEESEVLQNIQERTAIIERLRDADIGPLFDDLSARHVPAEHVAAELEQAWWQTALEWILAHESALLGANTGVIERLESDFRLVDDAHATSNAATLAAHLADAWRVAVIDNRQEATLLRDALRAGASTPAELITMAPNLMAILAPVWAMSPYEVSLLPADTKFDTVLLVDAAAISTAEALGAVRRARQVVAFGDPVIQTPAPFNIGVSDADYYIADAQTSALAQTPQSIYAALSGVLPQLQLCNSYRAGGADLTDLVNSKYYNGAIATLPWAGTFFGRSSLTHEYVRDGNGLPDQHTDAVESTDAEVERVVQLVLEHAAQRPNESLMVITASKKHAARVWQSTLVYFAKFPEYRDFLLGEQAEPFTVVTLEQATALSRDRVIFSIGYGRTPHGHVLSNFGPLSQPGSDRLIAVAMTRARRGMTIVSCFSAKDLENVRAQHGVAQLAAIIGAESKPVPEPELPAELDPLVADLAQRLTDLGLEVALNYQGRIPLAASLGERAIAVDIDFSGADDESMRHILRLRPAVLRRLGWHYQRVQSFDLFQDPAEVALRIAGIIGYDADAAAQQRTENITEQGLALSDDQHNVTQVIQSLPTLPQPDAVRGVGSPVRLEPFPLAQPDADAATDVAGDMSDAGAQMPVAAAVNSTVDSSMDSTVDSTVDSSMDSTVDAAVEADAAAMTQESSRESNGK